MGGRKNRLSVHRKNEERKRHSPYSLAVSIPLSSGVAILPVSVPLSTLSFKIHLPIGYFLTSPIISVNSLQLKLQKTSLPPCWLLLSVHSDSLVLCKMDSSQVSSPKVQIALTVHSDLHWSVAVCSHLIEIKNDACEVWNLPSCICCIGDLRKLLDFFSDCKMCAGSSEDNLLKLIKYKDSTPQGALC